MKVISDRVQLRIRQWRRKIAKELADDTVNGVSEGNHIQLFYDGDTAYSAMLQAIKDAHSFVHLEIYMFLSDEVGRSFASQLAPKARQKVPVRVIYDAIGSSETDSKQWEVMRNAGVEIIEYRPVRLWHQRAGILGRNHRKNLIIDGSVAFTGGMNLGNMWSQDRSGDTAWRDTQIKIEGPAATDINQLFLDTWIHCTGQGIPCSSVQSAATATHTGTHGRCMVIGSRGIGDRKQIRHLYSVHLDQAEHSVKMTVPYFVPPRRLRLALLRARNRGVQISLLMPRDSDVRIVDWLREGLYPKLLDWGVHVIEYLGPTLHAKTMVIDNHTAIIGSTNFDILSLHMNRETALVIFDDEVVTELNQQWDHDLMLSERVSYDWRGLRPWWRLMTAKLGCLIIRRL